MKYGLFVLSLTVLATGCTAESDQSGSDAACVGPSCANTEQSKDNYEIGIDTGGSGSGGEGTGSAAVGDQGENACGVVTAECDPEDDGACLGAGGDASDKSSGDDEATASWSCQVTSVAGLVHTTCETAGTGMAGDPCMSAAECTPGYACVEQSGTAQCRLYCCSDAESCPTSTYCAVRTKKELVDSKEPLSVMVCIPSEACRFDEPYPCDTTTNVCSCADGRACGLVRSDGTTACVVPGTGTSGEACPCAAQHVCSEATQTCLKVCRLGEVGSCGDEGTCQASTNLGSEWGVCVTPISLTH
jgi:hypothetical protein